MNCPLTMIKSGRAESRKSSKLIMLIGVESRTQHDRLIQTSSSAPLKKLCSPSPSLPCNAMKVFRMLSMTIALCYVPFTSSSCSIPFRQINGRSKHIKTIRDEIFGTWEHRAEKMFRFCSEKMIQMHKSILVKRLQNKTHSRGSGNWADLNFIASSTHCMEKVENKRSDHANSSPINSRTNRVEIHFPLFRWVPSLAVTCWKGISAAVALNHSFLLQIDSLKVKIIPTLLYSRLRTADEIEDFILLLIRQFPFCLLHMKTIWQVEKFAKWSFKARSLWSALSIFVEREANREFNCFAA